MKFHDYRPIVPRLRQINPKLDEEEDAILIRHAQIELKWNELKRPYYNIWPSMLDPFYKIDVQKIPREYLRLPMPAICIRFPMNSGRVMSVLAASDEKMLAVIVDRGACYDGSDWPCPSLAELRIDDDSGIPSIESFLDEVGSHDLSITHDSPAKDDSIQLAGDVYESFVIVAALCLVARDPDLVVQKLLKNAPDTPEQRERAVRRGCHEFDVGRNVVAAPGYRKPHFAIRWMGHGEKKEPRLRPVKGCIVMRSVVEEVPTGYLDDEGGKNE